MADLTTLLRKLKLKTKPFKHQKKALSWWERAFFAYLMEQGTGKSWVVIITAALLWLAGKIDLLLILAPKGVAPAWLRQQLPEHMPSAVPYEAALWRSKSNRTKALERQLTATMKAEGKLRIIIMNSEAFSSTADALDYALEVLDLSESAMVVVDESHRIKTNDTSTTKRILKLRVHSAYRRILTGTIGDKPFDLFPQFGFLSPEILGTDSYVAFRAEYAVMMPANHGLMRHIIQRNKIPMVNKGNYGIKWRELDEDLIPGKPKVTDAREIGKRLMELLVANSPQIITAREPLMEPKWVPQMVAKDKDDKPMYKNLDKLQKLIEPHSYRVLKADCLDIPEKTYGRYYTELSDEQRTLYDRVKREQRIEWEDGAISTFSKLTVLLRLQQIICGYVPKEGEEDMRELFKTWEENPRILSTLDYIADRPKGEYTIIWCRFIEDILRMSAALREAYGDRSVVQFYGAVKDKDRFEAVARFQGERIFMDKRGNILRKEEVPDKDRARFMLAQQRAGGVGQTWTAASLSLHYSNTFSYIDRKQAEDRPHRIGQRNVVQYTDIEAEDTVDTTIISSMLAKEDTANAINNDPGFDWLTPNDLTRRAS